MTVETPKPSSKASRLQLAREYPNTNSGNGALGDALV